VNNPGFELFTANCGTNDIQLYYSQSPVQNWSGIQDNNPLAGSTPDYFSPCAGVTNSANNSCITGTARIGLFTKTSFANGREYVQTQLSTPLVAGKEYCFSMNVKSRVGAAGNQLSDCDGIGAWFHNQGMIDITTMNGGQQYLGPGSIINASPQIENPSGNLIDANCVVVSGTFCATSNEQFLVIGNFRNDANTMITGPNPNNYMYIDDVSLFEICPIDIDLTADNDSIPCGGATNLTVNSTNTSLSYQWIPNNLGFVGPGPHLFAPSSTTTVSVIGSYVNSCGLTVADTSTLNIFVEPCTPTSVLSDTSLCYGECIILEPDTLFGGTLPYSSFQWIDPSNNSISYGFQSPQYCPSTSSQYIFSFEDASGIITYDTASVMVNTYPIVNAGQDTSICFGDQIQLQGNFDVGIPEWLTIGPGSQFVVSPSIDQYYVFLSDYNGCLSYDTLFAEVNPLPLTNFITEHISCFGGNDGSILETIDHSYSYNWGAFVDSSYISGLTAGTYPVSVIDTNGCVSSDTITISQPNQLNLSYSGSSTVCGSDSVKVAVHVFGGTPLYQITIGNAQADSITFIAEMDTTIFVTVIDSQGCQLNDSISIIVEPRSVADFSNFDTICSGQLLEVENLSTDASVFQWFVDNMFVSDNNDLILNNLSPGCHDIALVASNVNGCLDSLSKICAVNVVQTPESIIHTNMNNSVDIGEPIIVYDNSVGGSSCSWILDDQVISNNCVLPSPLVFNETGNYELYHIVINDFGCSDTSIIYFEVVDPITVYVPNAFTPDGDEFNNVFIPIIRGQIDEYTFHLELFNRWGELIFESHNLNVGWDGTYNSFVVQNGIYVWVIKFKELDTDNKHEYKGHVLLIK